MARTYWRVTHHPVALVYSPGGLVTLLVVGQDLPFFGGQRVAMGAESLKSQGLDLPALNALEAAFLHRTD